MGARLRVLQVEDSESDALLVVAELKHGGCEVEALRVDSRSGLDAALEDGEWDVILADHSLPGFSGLEALDMLRERDLDIPVIVVTGTISEESAAAALRAGARDFVTKGRLTRLLPAIEREVAEAAARRRAARSLQQLNQMQLAQRNLGREIIQAKSEGDLVSKAIAILRALPFLQAARIALPAPDGQASENGRIVVPLLVDGAPVGLLSAEPVREDASDEDLRAFLGEFAQDTGTGIRSLRIEKRLATSLLELRRTHAQVIDVITSISESRDPYTAGHQRRVAQLAYLIASEMGFSQERAEQVRTASLIHDVGKIAIPSELLAKPARLTRIEFEMIKTHSETGSEILKSIVFPWPLAEIVRQHHERMDGSGYPRGLRAEGILEEARILAVADVVEAMSSHRPYRAALGIERALEEIERERGSAYDARAVDACLRMVREMGFRFD